MAFAYDEVKIKCLELAIENSNCNNQLTLDLAKFYFQVYQEIEPFNTSGAATPNR